MAESDEVYHVHEDKIVSQVKTEITMECKPRKGGGVRLRFMSGNELVFDAALTENAAVLLATRIVDGK